MHVGHHLAGLSVHYDALHIVVSPQPLVLVIHLALHGSTPIVQSDEAKSRDRVTIVHSIREVLALGEHVDGALPADVEGRSIGVSLVLHILSHVECNIAAVVTDNTNHSVEFTQNLSIVLLVADCIQDFLRDVVVGSTPGEVHLTAGDVLVQCCNLSVSGSSVVVAALYCIELVVVIDTTGDSSLSIGLTVVQQRGVAVEGTRVDSAILMDGLVLCGSTPLVSPVSVIILVGRIVIVQVVPCAIVQDVVVARRTVVLPAHVTADKCIPALIVLTAAGSDGVLCAVLSRNLELIRSEEVLGMCIARSSVIIVSVRLLVYEVHKVRTCEGRVDELTIGLGVATVLRIPGVPDDCIIAVVNARVLVPVVVVLLLDALGSDGAASKVERHLHPDIAVLGSRVGTCTVAEPLGDGARCGEVASILMRVLLQLVVGNGPYEAMVGGSHRIVVVAHLTRQVAGISLCTGLAVVVVEDHHVVVALAVVGLYELFLSCNTEQIGHTIELQAILRIKLILGHVVELVGEYILREL